MLDRYQSNPSMDHKRVVKKTMWYLQGTNDYMLTYKKFDHLEIVGDSY